MIERLQARLGGKVKMGDGFIGSSKSSSSVRDATLDFVKGALVVVMVIYHAMNIFSTASPDAYAYIRFVSGSFILMAGYVVARFHRLAFAKDRGVTSRRLVVRGIKLLLLFTVLNVLINIAGVGNPDKAQGGILHYASRAFEVYVLGKPGYASFQILLPISYLLIAAPVFLALGEYSVAVLGLSLVGAFVSSRLGIGSVNLEFALVGAAGFACGLLANPVLESFVIRRAWMSVACLAAWVALMGHLSDNLAIQTIGTMVILKLLYDFGRSFRVDSVFADILVVLGQYSLVCYIGQIVLMQLASAGLARPRRPLGLETLLIVFGTIVVLAMMSWGLALFRKRWSYVDKAYKLVFS